MVVLITDIKTPNWQLSLAGFGQVVLDGDDILQCIHNIIFTLKGTVPFDMDFGSNVLKCVSLPHNRVVPVVTNELYSAIKKYEPRVRIVSIGAVQLLDYSLRFEINLIVIGSSKPLTYSLDLINSSKTGGRAFSDGFSGSYS